jgi:hypothetical protein
LQASLFVGDTIMMVPVLIAVGVVLAIAIGVYAFTRRPAAKPAVFESEREEKLANAVARKVGCSPAAAVPAVRQELDHSPGQSDDVLTKRAVYHYQQSIPERTCRTYRDSSPG